MKFSWGSSAPCPLFSLPGRKGSCSNTSTANIFILATTNIVTRLLNKIPYLKQYIFNELDKPEVIGSSLFSMIKIPVPNVKDKQSS